MTNNKLLKGDNTYEVITFPLYGRERDVGDGLRVITDISEGDKIATINQTSGYRDWETDRKSTRLNSSHITRSRMPSSA